MRYVLNSAVITASGTYDYAVIDVEAARAWAASAPYVSTIGYAETAELASELLGQPVPVQRIMIQMRPGDEALVIRLALPPGAPRINPADKGRLGEVLRAGHIEFGILRRIS